MKELALALMVWINGASDLPIPDQQPIIQHESYETLWRMYAPDQEYRPDVHKVKALYANDFIYLPDTWSAQDLDYVSSLLHELVHHMQAHSGNQYDCRGQKEAEAYDLQFQFLESAGVEDPKDFIGVNGLFLAFVTTCNPHAR
jgi:hypothetical protein